MIRVNIKSLVNNASIRREKRNGRDVIIVPSATLPDNVVMNGILYPAEEIEKSYESLERSPAPLGHPRVGNRYISARDPEAINGFWIGAHNENVRRDNGRVYLDKVIDVEFANRTEDGKALLSAIDKNEPVHTSTGVLMKLNKLNSEETQMDGPSKGKKYAAIAQDMMFDHDAILLNDVGAAQPADGVGMLVNGEEVDVVESDLDVSMDDEVVEGIARSVTHRMLEAERDKKFQSVFEKVASKIKSLMNSEPELLANHEDKPMPVTEDEFKALQSSVEKLTANALTAENVGEALATTITNAVTSAIEPIKAQVEEITATNKAAEEAEKATLTERLVNVGLLDSEEDAKELTLNAMRKLADKAKPGAAAPLAGHFTGNDKDDKHWEEYDMNANIEQEAK